MATWRSREPARVEPPAWYRSFDPAQWDEPDAGELAMMAGATGQAWPDAPVSRWENWPQFIHVQHAKRRWEEARHGFRQANPLLAEQEFQRILDSRAVRRD